MNDKKFKILFVLVLLNWPLLSGAQFAIIATDSCSITVSDGTVVGFIPTNTSTFQKPMEHLMDDHDVILSIPSLSELKKYESSIKAVLDTTKLCTPCRENFFNYTRQYLIVHTRAYGPILLATFKLESSSESVNSKTFFQCNYYTQLGGLYSYFRIILILKDNSMLKFETGEWR